MQHQGVALYQQRVVVVDLPKPFGLYARRVDNLNLVLIDETFGPPGEARERIIAAAVADLDAQE